MEQEPKRRDLHTFVNVIVEAQDELINRGLSTNEIHMLMILYITNTPMCRSAIAREHDLPRETARRKLEDLVRRDMVMRLSAPDGTQRNKGSKANFYMITHRGATLVENSIRRGLALPIKDFTYEDNWPHGSKGAKKHERKAAQQPASNPAADQQPDRVVRRYAGVDLENAD